MHNTIVAVVPVNFKKTQEGINFLFPPCTVHDVSCDSSLAPVVTQWSCDDRDYTENLG